MGIVYFSKFQKSVGFGRVLARAFPDDLRYNYERYTIELNIGFNDGRFVFPSFETYSEYTGRFEKTDSAASLYRLLRDIEYQSGSIDASSMKMTLRPAYEYGSYVANTTFAMTEGVPSVELAFVPVWKTLPGKLDLTEGGEASASLVAYLGHVTEYRNLYTVEGSNKRQAYLSQGQSLASVKANGLSVNYVVTGQIVEIDNVVDSSRVEFVLTEGAKFSILSGELPPGLTLSEEGEIVGTVGKLRNIRVGEKREFPVTFRASKRDDSAHADLDYTIEVTATTNSVNNPEWVDPAPTGGVQSLGSFARGAPVSIAIQTTRPDGVGGILTVVPVLVPGIDEDFRGLPPGLTMSLDGIISGTIAPASAIGVYTFSVMLRNARNESASAIYRTFSLTLIAPSGPLSPLRFLKWTTPAGLIGTFNEGETCPVGVHAYATTGETVTYQILAASPLPDGLNLNTETGDIEGVFTHVSTETDAAFSVRARVGESFIDREFILKIMPRYAVAGTTNVSLKLRRSEEVPMSADYAPLIPLADFFRPSDPNFGVLDDLSIYLIGGLSNPNSVLAPVDEVAAAVRRSPTGGPIKLRLGKHKVAIVKIGPKIVYEVLYREVIDPMARAGGFTVTNGVPTRNPLLYPQSNPAAPTYLYPESINNYRYEFVTEVGFAAFNPALNKTPGLGGPENLPKWMTIPQVGTSTSSILGFIPAMVVAYLKPGAAQRALDRLSLRKLDTPQPLDEPNPLLEGHEVMFDQFYLSYESLAEATSFDETTSFDDLTGFDEYSYQQGKYHRMNPKSGGN